MIINLENQEFVFYNRLVNHNIRLNCFLLQTLLFSLLPVTCADQLGNVKNVLYFLLVV